jgi:hypothetical protein
MKKIIITGLPRSGTTALANLLNHSPKIVITNELGIFDHNQEHYKTRSEAWLKNNKPTQKFLSRKRLTGGDINDFLAGNFTNKNSLEFYGDKFPTYCADRHYCSHLSQNHSDAYFIFTHRNPCATIYSGVHRSNLHVNQTHADWFYKGLEDSTNKFRELTLNWSNFIYPYVKNKIIIDYDRYINNFDLLVNDLSKFLNTSLDLPKVEQMDAVSGSFDVSYIESRGIYNNSKLDAYKNFFSLEEIDYINRQTNYVNLYVNNLITNQENSYK